MRRRGLRGDMRRQERRGREENGQERKRERKGKSERLQITGISHFPGPLVSHPEPGLSTVLGNAGCPQVLGCLWLFGPWQQLWPQHSEASPILPYPEPPQT